MQITDYLSSYFGPRHFCSTHDAHRISCCVNRSSPRRFRWAHARQPSCNLGPTRRPECRRYSRHVARRRRAAGRLRDKGVTYYSVDLGRAQRGGRDNDADRDATVIPVIPGRRPHQGRCRGAGHHRPGRRGRRRAAGPRTASPPGAGTLGHQFQLRMARSFPLSGRCRRAGSPVPVAHCRSSRSQGFLEVSVVTSSSCALPFLPGRRGISDVAAATGSRCAAVRLRARVCAAVTRSSCASRTSFRNRREMGRKALARLSAVAGSTVITPGAGAAHRLSRLLPAPPTSGDTSVVTRLRSADSETSRG